MYSPSGLRSQTAWIAGHSLEGVSSYLQTVHPRPSPFFFLSPGVQSTSMLLAWIAMNFNCALVVVSSPRILPPFPLSITSPTFTPTTSVSTQDYSTSRFLWMERYTKPLTRCYSLSLHMTDLAQKGCYVCFGSGLKCTQQESPMPASHPPRTAPLRSSSMGISLSCSRRIRESKGYRYS